MAFALGSALAGLGGALGVEALGMDPEFPVKYIVYFLIVVAVGGSGNIKGSLYAALLIGIADVAGKYYFPQIGAFVIYAVMVVTLIFRPQGLFGADRGQMNATRPCLGRARAHGATWRRCARPRAGGWPEFVFWLLPVIALVRVLRQPARSDARSRSRALFALSLDLILGYAGIISLGHAAFFGIGAYTAGLLAKSRLRRPAARTRRRARAWPRAGGLRHELPRAARLRSRPGSW